MTTTTAGALVLAGLVALVALAGLHWLGQFFGRIAEGVATIAVVFVTVWLVGKATVIVAVWVVRHWRTTITTVGVVGWCWLWGWPLLLGTVVAAVLVLSVWWWVSVVSFDRGAGRRLRAWWLRWTVYAPRMPRWLRSCNLTVPDRVGPAVAQVNPLRRTPVVSRSRPVADQLPRIVGVRSGPSWDEVRVRLVAGQTPEEFDTATRALAVARGVRRCQVREVAPNVVSIDFQRRNLLDVLVRSPGVETLSGIDGAAVDLGKVWSGRTEYGTDWWQSLIGGHTLVAGATGAGKGSLMWAPLVSVAPAIRDGLVRVNGIDPKGMELAYGRGVFHRYAVTSKDALALLDDLVEQMEARKRAYAGATRLVPITTETPLEIEVFSVAG